MSAGSLRPAWSRSSPAALNINPTERSVLLLAGLGCALSLRLLVAGNEGARSTSAGATFAASLLTIVLLAGCRPRPITIGSIRWGLVGTAVLLVVPVWLRVTGGTPPIDLPSTVFVSWALVVSAVAITEELVLRGVLFSAIERSAGSSVAVGVTAVVFALLHVPLYGVGVLPLDLTVGVWLGALRLLTGSVTAPALAHTLADLAAWWLV